MNLDLLYAILIALIFVCIFILFSKFSILNTAITAIVFYMLYNVIFTAEDDNDTIIIIMPVLYRMAMDHCISF